MEVLKAIINRHKQVIDDESIFKIYLSARNSPLTRKKVVNYIKKRSNTISNTVDIDELLLLNEGKDILLLDYRLKEIKTFEVLKKGINAFCNEPNAQYILTSGNETLLFNGSNLLRRLHGMHHQTFYKMIDKEGLTNQQKILVLISWMNYISDKL